jgi:hypothetical protein
MKPGFRIRSFFRRGPNGLFPGGDGVRQWLDRPSTRAGLRMALAGSLAGFLGPHAYAELSNGFDPANGADIHAAIQAGITVLMGGLAVKSARELYKTSSPRP